jgi:hypothetical protein
MVAQNIRIWSSTATKLRSAEGVQIGGSARASRRSPRI